MKCAFYIFSYITKITCLFSNGGYIYLQMVDISYDIYDRYIHQQMFPFVDWIMQMTKLIITILECSQCFKKNVYSNMGYIPTHIFKDKHIFKIFNWNAYSILPVNNLMNGWLILKKGIIFFLNIRILNTLYTLAKFIILDFKNQLCFKERNKVWNKKV